MDIPAETDDVTEVAIPAFHDTHHALGSSSHSGFPADPDRSDRTCGVSRLHPDRTSASIADVPAEMPRDALPAFRRSACSSRDADWLTSGAPAQATANKTSAASDVVAADSSDERPSLVVAVDLSPQYDGYMSAATCWATSYTIGYASSWSARVHPSGAGESGSAVGPRDHSGGRKYGWSGESSDVVTSMNAGIVTDSRVYGPTPALWAVTQSVRRSIHTSTAIADIRAESSSIETSLALSGFTAEAPAMGDGMAMSLHSADCVCETYEHVADYSKARATSPASSGSFADLADAVASDLIAERRSATVYPHISIPPYNSSAAVAHEPVAQKRCGPSDTAQDGGVAPTSACGVAAASSVPLGRTTCGTAPASACDVSESARAKPESLGRPGVTSDCVVDASPARNAKHPSRDAYLATSPTPYVTEPGPPPQTSARTEAVAPRSATSPAMACA
jgi:hypothetical protein